MATPSKIPGDLIVDGDITADNLQGFPLVTVGPSAAQYTTIADAVANSGAFGFYIKGAVTEVADIEFSVDGDYSFFFAPNASDDLSTYKFNILNGVTANIKIYDGSLSYAYGSAQNMITYTGTGSGNLYVNGVLITNASTVDGCYVNGTPGAAGPTQTFIGCTVQLPDQDLCGLQFSAGVGMDLTFVSGGSSCRGAITASRGQFAAIKFKGAAWSSGVIASFGASNVNGLLVTSETGTPSVRVWITSPSTLQGVYAEGTSSFVIILLANASITNFDTGAAGTIFLASSSGFSAISNGVCVQNLISSNGAQVKFSNVRFTSSVGIEAVGSLFSNCSFDGDNQIRANNVHLSNVSAGVPGGVGGNTFTITTGFGGCSIIGSNSEVIPVDSSGLLTNTLFANALW